MFYRNLFISLVAAAVISGCGGGGGRQSPLAPPPVDPVDLGDGGSVLDDVIPLLSGGGARRVPQLLDLGSNSAILRNADSAVVAEAAGNAPSSGSVTHAERQ
jgi:hypothetical protein